MYKKIFYQEYFTISNYNTVEIDVLFPVCIIVPVLFLMYVPLIVRFHFYILQWHN